VTGLARSDASAKKLTASGAQVLRGSIEDLDCLRREAAAADGAIHKAFYHEITQMPMRTRLRVVLGGAPSGIVSRLTAAAAVGAGRRYGDDRSVALRHGPTLSGCLRNPGDETWAACYRG
jgi:hypothetical protein